MKTFRIELVAERIYWIAFTNQIIRGDIMRISLLSVVLCLMGQTAWASDFQTGTFNCSVDGKTIHSTWKISAFSQDDSIPFLEVTFADAGNGPGVVKGLGILEKTPKGLLVGIPKLVSHSTTSIFFANDGSIVVGVGACVKEMVHAAH